MALRRILILIAAIACVVLMIFSVNLGLLAIVVLFAYVTYRLLVKKDFTILATNSLVGKEYQNLTEETKKKYEIRATQMGWVCLAITILVVIVGIVIND